MNAKSIRTCIISMHVCLLSLVLVVLVMAAVPPVSRDALTHHLAVPKLWIQHGGMVEIPDLVFSYYPMNLDLLYVIPLLFGNDITPKYIHFAFALLTAGIVYQYLKKRLSRVYGTMGALFFLSTPIIVRLSTSVYVDLGLIFFSTASLLQLLYWKEKQYAVKSIVISGIYCGLAMGTKYNGLIVLLVLSCTIPFLYMDKFKNNPLEKKKVSNQARAIGFSGLFCVAALIVFSPWMIRNIVLTKNPIYPLYKNHFGDSANRINTNDLENESRIRMKNIEVEDSGYNHFAVRKMVYGESLGQIILIPLRIFFEGVDDNPKYFDGQLNPFLLLLPLLLFFPIMGKNSIYSGECRILLFFSITYVLFVFFKVDMRIRWISPIVPPMVILSVGGIEKFCRWGKTSFGEWKKRASLVVSIMIIAVVLSLNISYIYSLFRTIDPMSYLCGQMDRDSYIRRFRPEYDLINYANRNLPENTIILSMFIGNRVYYFDRTFLNNPGILKKSLLSSDSVDKMENRLRQMGITHVLLRFDLFDKWLENNFAEEKRALLKDFFRYHMRLLRSYNGYGLFELFPLG